MYLYKSTYKFQDVRTKEVQKAKCDTSIWSEDQGLCSIAKLWIFLNMYVYCASVIIHFTDKEEAIKFINKTEEKVHII